MGKMKKTNQKIPEGWSVKKLGEMGKFVSGGTPDTEKPEYWNGDIIWLTPSEITKLPTRFVSDSERKITRAGLKNSSAVLLPVGSLIICTRATVGDCCINIKEVSTNQGFKNLIPENSNIDFLYYLISSHKTDLIRKACGSTFLEISKHDIEKLKYSVPPLSEQEKIAEILGAWDLAIEKLTALIEQKKLLKKGLMQRLLTGKQRLPGFSTPWNKVKLGECLSLLKDGTHGTHQNSPDGIMLLSAKDIINGNILLPSDSRRISQKDFNMLHKNYHLQNDDVALTIVGTIGRCAIIKNYSNNFTFQRSVAVLRPNKTIISKFLYILLQGKKIQNALFNRQSISAQPGIYLHDLSKISFNLPPLPEQKAIADILSKADEEIDLLTRKLSALKEQKTGLMQQLLTGKIRVKVA